VPGLLFLTQRIPYPPIKGEKIRPLQILHHLRQYFDVHIGCLVDDPRDYEHEPTIAALCTSSYFARLDRARAKFTCLSGLLTGAPLSVTFYHDAGLARWVEETVERVRPEAIFVCSSNMAPYVLDLRGPGAQAVQTRLCDLADVDSEKWHAYGEIGRWPMSWVHTREWHKTAALEARIAQEFNWSTFVSQEEADLFIGLQPAQAAKIKAVGSGVDHAYFDPSHPFAAPYNTDRANFVFTGTMDYPPNIGAVTWFAEEILPLIRAQAEGAQFHIVGSSPSPDVQALAALPGVFVTGRVPDVRPYLAHATAGVAPMRIARGIQNKVLESMAMARPTVVTQDALTGIAAVAGEEVILANTTEDFAKACLTVWKSGAQTIGLAARQRVLSNFIWAQKLRGFDAMLGIGASAAPQENVT